MPRRRGAPGPLTAAALAAFVALVFVVLSPQPAGAETTITVEAGIEGAHTPGEPVPVRVRVQADRLIEGQLRVTTRANTGSQRIERSIEVPGGSVKEFTILVGTQMWEAPSIRVDVLDGGERVAGDSVSLTTAPDEELVGVLPVLAESIEIPKSSDLSFEAGTARFGPIDGSALDLGRDGLAIYDTIVGQEADLGNLSEGQRGSLMHWVATGGTLLLDSPRSTPVDGLPDEAQPGEGGWQRLGEGTIRLTAGAAGAGRWDEILYPTGSAGASQDGELVVQGPAMEGEFSPLLTLAEDAGFRLPEARDLVLLLLLYAVLVGPVTALLLRPSKRRTLAWVTVPVLAGIFTGVVYVQGEELRSASGTSHSTLLEVTPYGTQATTNLLIGARNGGTISLTAPANWRGQPLVDPWDFEVRRASATSVELSAEETEVKTDLDPGEFQGLRLEGPVAGAPGLRVRAVSSADGVVRTEVTNNFEVDLHEVVVFVEDHAERVGDLAAGETTEVDLDGVTEAVDAGTADLDAWDELDNSRRNGPVFGADFGEDVVFDRFGRPVDPSEEGGRNRSAVDAGMWVDYLIDRGFSVRQPGEVMVVGWTNELPPPVAQGGRDVSRGRTAVVARSPVAPGGGRLTNAVVGRELVRAGGEAFARGPFEGAPPRNVLPDLEGGDGIFRFTLPSDVDGRPLDVDRLVFDLPSTMRGAFVLMPDGWQSLFVGLEGRRVVQLPEEAIRGGSVFVEVRGAGTMRQDVKGDDPTIYELPEGSDVEITTAERLEELDLFFAEAGADRSEP